MNARQAKEAADRWLENYLKTRMSEIKAQEVRERVQAERRRKEAAAEAERRARPLDETRLVDTLNHSQGSH